VFILGISVGAGFGVYYVLKKFMPFACGERPALDLILFIGSFTLPFLAPFAIAGLSSIVSKLLFGTSQGFGVRDYSEAGLVRSAGFVFILLAVSIGVGVRWNWRRWLPAAAIFYVIFVLLFTTFFTNGNGLATGMVGSLGYWLEQQEVQRGSQPLYYYFLLVPLYEYLPLIGFIGAVLYALIKGLTPRNTKSSLEIYFILLLFFWTVMTWVAYSFAGEKMPWLTTHFAIPLALSTGWVVGKLIDRTDWRSLWRRGGWIAVLIAPIALAALVQTLNPWLSPSVINPFAGYTLNELNSTMQFVAALLVLAGTGAGLYWITQRIGLRSLLRLLSVVALAGLAVLTLRTAWIFAYVNYDYANEFLVYAHSTPDVRVVMEQVEDISRRTAGDLSLDIAYTSDGSYPFIWYLRNYPNASVLPNPPSRPDLDKSIVIAGDEEWGGIEPYIGDRFTCNRYNFLWWPMQDYYDLNWERISYALTNPEMRAAVWDIIVRRDYAKYEEATGKTVRVSEWPLRDSFRYCVRNDVLARIWDESAGTTSFVPPESPGVPTEPAEGVPDYTALEQPVAADVVLSELGPAGAWNAPHGLATDAAGNLYVADSNNHRIVKVSPEGEVLDTWDSTWWIGLETWKPGCLGPNDEELARGAGEFCEPWGVAVGPNDRVYVADTWNHRVQVFTVQGEFLGQVGAFGQSGSDVSAAPTLFYGPRDVIVSDAGQVYVSDTGNKRVQVFDLDLNHLFSFGGPGIVEGRLEEPVGLAIGPVPGSDPLLYVADTWNTRVQAFNLNGEFQTEWPILGWDTQSIANKPFLSTDAAGHVYVTDPENGRVVIFDAQGTAVRVLGGPTSNVLRLPTGVRLDASGNVWVSDPGLQRVLRFPPLELEQPAIGE
jgi:uncharacterized protein (TIGR03663 family)